MSLIVKGLTGWLLVHGLGEVGGQVWEGIASVGVVILRDSSDTVILEDSLW